jgi:hypothetical protein
MRRHGHRTLPPTNIYKIPTRMHVAATNRGLAAERPWFVRSQSIRQHRPRTGTQTSFFCVQAWDL